MRRRGVPETPVGAQGDPPVCNSTRIRADRLIGDEANRALYSASGGEAR
jgi:hypothetical protein